ncbi:MAG: V-type ATP synthase subunit F [Candidatus Bathyarchaeia archaeon]
MATIGVLVDRETATSFKITGIKNSYSVSSKEEAEKKLDQLLQNQEISLIFITEDVNEWLRPIINRIKRSREYPLITSIAGKRGKMPSTDQFSRFSKENSRNRNKNWEGRF